MYFPEKLTILWLKQAYKNGLDPTELIGEIIKKAEAHAEKNIWIVKPSEELILPYIKNLPSDRNSLPLWGIPFAIKDNIDLADVPTTAACPDYAYTPKKSAYVVNRLIKAGAIPIGKTNLDQFATGLVGTRSPYGETHNAYQPEMISGGSSSGSSISVALGMAAFALGTDTAGSGRVPAMLNALIGYKPPLGSWSTSGVVPACASLDCVTVFANNLDDAQTVDRYARGFDEECEWSREYKIKGEKLPEKIYIPKDEPRFYGSFSELYREKWNKAVLRIERLGIPVERIDCSMFEEAALILYEGAYVAERWQDLKEFVENNPESTFPVTERILRSGAKSENTAAQLFGDIHALQRYRHTAKKLLDNAVMIMPTAGGSFTRDEVRADPITTNSLMGLYTNHCNLLDLMAIAVPENSEDRKYPFGITIFGLGSSENLVCAFAKRFLESESAQIAVCGLHKKNRVLEYQLTELGAEYIKSAKTSADYRLYRLDTVPEKPGLVRTFDGGGGMIDVDIYSIPKRNFGIFIERVAMPLGIGDIRLSDGEIVKGFLCEQQAAAGCSDITAEGTF